MTVSSIYKKNRAFFIGYILLAILAFVVLFVLPKEEGHLFLNTWHNKPFDYTFRAFTVLGDGLFIISLAVLLFIFKRRYLSLMIVGSYLLSGIPVQILKSYFDAARPAVFLKGIDYAHFVEGVELHNYNSFPSGHTASAFALVVILAVSLRNKWTGLMLLILATLVGYSRVYLNQHFLQDVLAGSLIGVLSGIGMYLLLEKWIRKITASKVVKNSNENDELISSSNLM